MPLVIKKRWKVLCSKKNHAKPAYFVFAFGSKGKNIKMDVYTTDHVLNDDNMRCLLDTCNVHHQLII